MLWDVAGGIPVILGAGGKVNSLEKKEAHSLNVHVANGLIE